MAKIFLQKNFLAGVLFFLIGSGAVYMGQDYPMGSAQNMGPGFVPVTLGWILVVLGLANCVMSVRRADMSEMLGEIPVLPLVLIVAAMVVFGLLIENAGLLLAVTAVVIISNIAGRSFRPLEIALSLLVLLVLTGALFVFGMEQPIDFLIPH